MAQARAYLMERDFVIPNDVASVFSSVAAHRVRISSKAKMNQKTGEEVLEQLLEEVIKPSPEKGIS